MSLTLTRIAECINRGPPDDAYRRVTEKERNGGGGRAHEEDRHRRIPPKEEDFSSDLAVERKAGQASCLPLPTGSHMPIHARKTVNHRRSDRWRP
ncbi:hypothetical protein WN55_07578 [Dufourea novaeangliae]|uniref:Uncharacterized protein n=1 Tax=Dufourea novaeangliae TaxID=178035 RepID=A0A154P2F7_DUFNO|nr:hypothetical protein WN55_07578 [Dufourea novaeangliae]